jgi:predicted metalloendopeptidase
LAKLATVKVGVGYPDAWRDASGLAVVRGDAFGNLARAEAFAYRREIAKLSRPVDPGEWSQLQAQAVGAVIYFSPNTLQFSAGILQPPYFDPAGDAAANYGSAGAGMAHEISHILDELGSLYDARGRLVRWWTPQDLARYRAATAPLASQMAAHCPQPDRCLKGEQVVGESSADLVGLMVAHDAYVASLGGRPDVVKDGLTGDQRFFLAFARRWRRLQTEAALSQQVAADPHAPGEYRADTVRNLEAWARAFDVKPGDRLYLAPDARVRIW